MDAGELFWAQAVPPHRVTQFAPRPDLLDGRRTDGQVPWMTPSAPLYRALDLLRVRPWGYAAALGGRVHGRINLNTAQDARVLAAAADPQLGNGFTSDDVAAVWAALVGSPDANTNAPDYRTYAHQTRYQPDGTPVTVPVPGRTVDDDPTAATDVALDRPLRPPGAAQFGSGGLTPGGGVHDTLLRPPTGFVLPRAWLSATYAVGAGNTAAVVDRSHPYLRSEAARKLMNNVTTVSSVFTVTFTVVFHEVRTDPVKTWEVLREPGTGRPLLGREAYKEVPGDLRQQYFAVIDRSAAALDPQGGGAIASQRPFFTTLEAPAVPTAGTSRLTVAYGGFDAAARQMTFYSDGQPVTVGAGSRLVLGVGAGQEVVTVAADIPGVSAPFNPDGTVNVTGLTNPHAAGECVSNVRPGNPGPQPSFDRLAGTNPLFGALVPVLVRVR